MTLCIILTRLTRRAGLRRRLAKSGLSPRGKNGTFSEKNDKKGPKTGSGGIVPVGTISQFFRDFRGFPKIQVEKSRVGKDDRERRICAA